MRSIISIALLMLFSLSQVKSQSNYSYNPKASEQIKSKIMKDGLFDELKGISSKEKQLKDFAEIMSIVYTTDENQLPMMARAGMTELKDGGYINEKEYKILNEAFNDIGYSFNDYQAVTTYKNYSTEVSSEIFQLLKSEMDKPGETAQKGKKKFRIGFRGWVRIIFVTVAAIAGGIAGGIVGAAGGAMAGLNAANKWLNTNFPASSGGTGVMPGPDGRGDYVTGGFPFAN